MLNHVLTLVNNLSHCHKSFLKTIKILSKSTSFYSNLWIEKYSIYAGLKLIFYIFPHIHNPYYIYPSTTPHIIIFILLYINMVGVPTPPKMLLLYLIIYLFANAHKYIIIYNNNIFK